MGPFITLTVEPIFSQNDSKDIYNFEVRANIRTELKSKDDLNKALLKGKLDYGRHRYYRLAAEYLNRTDGRQLKRAARAINENGWHEISKVKDQTIQIYGPTGNGLALMDQEVRNNLAVIAACELAGLSMQEEDKFSVPMRKFGLDIALFLRDQDPEAPWLDGIEKLTRIVRTTAPPQPDRKAKNKPKSRPKAQPA